MKDTKLQIISNLFEGKEIRSIWVPEQEDYQFSVVDVINALAEPKDASDYLTTLKRRLIESVPSPKAEPFKLWLANLGVRE